MPENTNYQNNGNESKESESFLVSLISFVKGFIFPCFSPSFYKTVSKKRLIGPVVFFSIFALVLTSITTLQLVFGMDAIKSVIQGKYERGEFPTIIIENGIARVDGPQPFISESKWTILAVDTTGAMREIDTQKYNQGMLLTRTEIQVLNQNGYRTIPLKNLNESFGNPIVIDKAHALSFWSIATLWITILVFVGVLIWNSLFRFGYLVLLGLAFWGVVSLRQKGIGFSPIMIVGIYANVPAIYVWSILKLVKINFCGMYTLLLVVIWVLALWVVLKKKVDNVENPEVGLVE